MTLTFCIKILYLLLSRRFVPRQGIVDDYDKLAQNYDASFSANVAPCSRQLIQRLALFEEPIQALDLACGTGTITSLLDKNLSKESTLLAVDCSSGMIAEATKKVSPRVKFVQADMKQAVEDLPPDSFDLVTCGWAIGYSAPRKLLNGIHRILRPQGRIAIIENRQDTLAAVRQTGIEVMKRYPQHIRYLMTLPLRLPSSQQCLRRWLERSRFKVLDAWEGSIDFHFQNGHDTLAWVLRTGASAGFDQMMAPEARRLCDEAFIEIIEKNFRTSDGIRISHKFVAGIGQKNH